MALRLRGTVSGRGKPQDCAASARIATILEHDGAAMRFRYLAAQDQSNP